MGRVTVALLILVGLLNAVPVIGVVSADVLAGLYGIPAPDGDLLILMRHRALLFGIVGGFILASVLRPHLRPAAVIAGMVSMLGFVMLALSADDFGAKVHNIVIADIVGSVALAVVALMHLARKPA